MSYHKTDRSPHMQGYNYDPKAQQLTLHLRDGTDMVFSDVHQTDYQCFRQARSKWRYRKEYIDGRHPVLVKPRAPV